LSRNRLSFNAFDGYSVNLFLDEDGDWLAHFLEMPGISAFGDTPEAALAELEKAWRLAKKSYEENSESIPVAPSCREYSGQFNVRIGRKVHRSLAVQAAREGVSLNALVSRLLGEDANKLASV